MKHFVHLARGKLSHSNQQEMMNHQPMFSIAWSYVVEKLALSSIDKKGQANPVTIKDLLDSIPEELRTSKILRYSREFLGILGKPLHSTSTPTMNDDDQLMPSLRLVRYVLGVDEDEVNNDDLLGRGGFLLLRLIGKQGKKGATLRQLIDDIDEKLFVKQSFSVEQQIRDKLGFMMTFKFITCEKGDQNYFYLPRFRSHKDSNYFLEPKKSYPSLKASFLTSFTESIKKTPFQIKKYSKSTTQTVKTAPISLSVIFRHLEPAASPLIRFLTELEIDFLYQVQETDLKVIKLDNSDTPCIALINDQLSAEKFSSGNNNHRESSASNGFDKQSHFFVYRPEVQIQPLLEDTVRGIIEDFGESGCSIDDLVRCIKLPPFVILQYVEKLKNEDDPIISSQELPSGDILYHLNASSKMSTEKPNNNDSNTQEGETSNFNMQKYEKALFASIYGSDLESDDDKKSAADDDDESACLISDSEISHSEFNSFTEGFEGSDSTSQDYLKILKYSFKAISKTKCITIQVLWREITKKKLEPKPTRKMFGDCIRDLVESSYVAVTIGEDNKIEDFDETRSPIYLILFGEEIDNKLLEAAKSQQVKLNKGICVKPFRLLTKKALKRLIKKSASKLKDLEKKKNKETKVKETKVKEVKVKESKEKTIATPLKIDESLGLTDYEDFILDSPSSTKKRKRPPSSAKPKPRKSLKVNKIEIDKKVDNISMAEIEKYIKFDKDSTDDKFKETYLIYAAQVKILQCLLIPFEIFSEELINQYLSCFEDKIILEEALRQLSKNKFIRLKNGAKSQKISNFSNDASRIYHIFEPSQFFFDHLQKSSLFPFSEKMKKEFAEFERKWKNKKMEHSISIPQNTSGGSVAAILSSLVEGKVSLCANFNIKTRFDYTDFSIQVTDADDSANPYKYKKFIAMVQKYEPNLTLELFEPVNHAGNLGINSRYRDSHILSSIPISDFDKCPDLSADSSTFFAKCKKAKEEGLPLDDELLASPSVRDAIYKTGDLVRVPCGESFRVVSKEYSVQWTTMDSEHLGDNLTKSKSTKPRNALSSQKLIPIPANIWLNIDGTINGDVFAHLSWKALSVVENCPGIIQSELIKNFEPIIESSNAELLLEHLSQEGILFSRLDTNERRCWFGVRFLRRVPQY